MLSEEGEHFELESLREKRSSDLSVRLRKEGGRREGRGRDATNLRSLKSVPSRFLRVRDDDPLEQAGSILVSELQKPEAMTTTSQCRFLSSSLPRLNLPKRPSPTPSSTHPPIPFHPSAFSTLQPRRTHPLVLSTTIQHRQRSEPSR